MERTSEMVEEKLVDRGASRLSPPSDLGHGVYVNRNPCWKCMEQAFSKGLMTSRANRIELAIWVLEGQQPPDHLDAEVIDYNVTHITAMTRLRYQSEGGEDWDDVPVMERIRLLRRMGDMWPKPS